MLSEARSGVVLASDGSLNPLRTDRFGSLVGAESVGKYYELARQGRIFTASMTAAANFGTVLTATAVTFTLYNPFASTVNLAILQTTIAFGSQVANAETGYLVYAGNVDPAAAIPVTTTALTVRPALLGASANSFARAFSAATLPAAPVVVRVFPLGHSQVATTATAQSGLAGIDYVDGALALAPNTAVTLQLIKTTTETGIASMVWAEIPIA